MVKEEEKFGDEEINAEVIGIQNKENIITKIFGGEWSITPDLNTPLRVAVKKCPTKIKRNMLNVIERQKGKRNQFGKKKLNLERNKRIFECHLCKNILKNTTNLRIHMKRHFGGKRYGCDQCDRKFLHKPSLKRHKLIHTGEKPFECD